MNKFESRFTSEDVEVIRRKDCHRGFLQVEQIKLRHRLHEGGWSGDLQREVMIREKAVGVLLFDPALDQLVMIRQFRIGLLGESGSPWILECVAGLIDTDETPERVAVRETEEESGLKPSELIKICFFFFYIVVASTAAALAVFSDWIRKTRISRSSCCLWMRPVSLLSQELSTMQCPLLQFSG